VQMVWALGTQMGPQCDTFWTAPTTGIHQSGVIEQDNKNIHRSRYFFARFLTSSS
jgi:hypothetical protein